MSFSRQMARRNPSLEYLLDHGWIVATVSPIEGERTTVELRKFYSKGRWVFRCDDAQMKLVHDHLKSQGTP